MKNLEENFKLKVKLIKEWIKKVNYKFNEECFNKTNKKLIKFQKMKESLKKWENYQKKMQHYKKNYQKAKL